MGISKADLDAIFASLENYKPTPPDSPDTKIWRYMDFAKFVSMLENKGLFFCRASKLGDPFEGSLPEQNIKLREEQAKTWVPLAIDQTEAERQLLKEPEALTRGWRNWVMLNCWHMSEFESAAMWDIYGKSKQAVAIQSTYQYLVDCFADGSAQIGMVNYINYREFGAIPEIMHIPFWYKRKSFGHEQELRALMWRLPPDGTNINLDPPNAGIWKPIDLHKLIEKVYVAPQADDWFKDLVEKVVNTYNLEKPVEASDLDSPALF